MINWTLIYQSLPMLCKGMVISIEITFFALMIGLGLGTILGIVESKGHWILRYFIKVYVTIIRGTPMIVQISFFYYLLPQFGLSFSALQTAIIAIGLNSSAYISQIIKSGISAVGKDQVEAAKVLGFTNLQSIYYFVLPQAIRYVLPALANESITLIKDSSLASIIGVNEMYKESRSIISQTYDVVSIYVLLAFLYLMLTGIISLTAQQLEKRMNKHA